LIRAGFVLGAWLSANGRKLHRPVIVRMKYPDLRASAAAPSNIA
jgi:hypothetical protein